MKTISIKTVNNCNERLHHTTVSIVRKDDENDALEVFLNIIDCREEKKSINYVVRMGKIYKLTLKSSGFTGNEAVKARAGVEYEIGS